MSDRILLQNMVFEACHGVNDVERREAQRFEVDVEMSLDLQPAGEADELARTIDYREVFAITREVVESTSYQLIEALAEAIAHAVLARFQEMDEVMVRVRKPQVQLGGPLDFAGVEIRRRR